MSEASSNNMAAGRLHYHQPRDFYFALGFAALAVLLHTSTLMRDFWRVAEVKTLTSNTISLVLLIIEFALLVNAIGLLSRRRIGIFVSIIALCGVGAGYILWYAYSREILDLLSSESFYQLHADAVPAHPFGLIGATWPNLAVLVMSGVLFIWEAKALRGPLRLHK